MNSRLTREWGGGHSAISPALGLGVGRVLQFKIVTPDGQYPTVNQCQNQDLFFALRGGGTFAVVLESFFVASPQVTVQACVFLVIKSLKDVYRINLPASLDCMRVHMPVMSLLKALAKSAVQLATDGWGGYITVCLPLDFNHPQWRLTFFSSKPTASSAIWANPVLNADDAQKSAAALVTAFESVGGNVTFFTMDSYSDFFDTFIAPNTDVCAFVSLPNHLTFIRCHNSQSAAPKSWLVVFFPLTNFRTTLSSKP